MTGRRRVSAAEEGREAVLTGLGALMVALGQIGQSRPLQKAASLGSVTTRDTQRRRRANQARRAPEDLFATYHSSLPIAIYILLLAIVGIIATSLLTDYTGKDISEEYAGV